MCAGVVAGSARGAAALCGTLQKRNLKNSVNQGQVEEVGAFCVAWEFALNGRRFIGVTFLSASMERSVEEEILDTMAKIMSNFERVRC